MANCAKCGRQLPAFSFRKVCQWCVEYEATRRGEVGEDAKQRVMPAPWVQREHSISLTQIIFGINIAVFLGMALAAGNPFEDFSTQLTVHWGANWGPLTLSGEWWRLLTCVFVHGGIIHLAFNMWCLWNLGKLCESLYGRWTYAAVYLISGLGASVTSVAWHPGGASVGASGAIFGLAGALIAAYKLGEFSLPRAALSGTLQSLAMFVGYNLLFGIFGNTDNAAHIGGLITGLILGALIARVAPHREQSPRRVALLLFVTLAVTGGALGLARWHGFPLRLGRADTFHDDGGSNRSIASLEQIVKQKPNFMRGHLALARAYFNQGQYPQAETEFKRVLELDPQQAEARINLGIAYLNQKRLSEASDVFKQALAQNPNDADAHVGMGLALAAEENHQAAIEEFKTAERLNTQYSGLYAEMGASYAKLKMYDEAIAAYLKEKEMNGDDADIENGLAAVYQAKGLTQQAEEARGKAQQLRPGH